MARAVVSQRIPRGMALMYHAQEKNVNVPGSNTTGKRGGILNSVTRVVVKPTNMVGGYAQLAYSFNYYGTVGCQPRRSRGHPQDRDQDIDWLERPLTPEREAQRNPWASARRLSADSRPEELQEKQMKIARNSRWCSTSTSASVATPAR